MVVYDYVRVERIMPVDGRFSRAIMVEGRVERSSTPCRAGIHETFRLPFGPSPGWVLAGDQFIQGAFVVGSLIGLKSEDKVSRDGRPYCKLTVYKPELPCVG